MPVHAHNAEFFFPDEEAGQKDAPGKDSGKGRKAEGEKKGPKWSEKANSGGKTERSGFGQPGHWQTKEEALAGVPTKERKEYGSSKDNCWRCGRAGHNTFECYVGTTTGGTVLPTAPWRGASSAKRKRDGDNNVEAPAQKQSKVTTIKTEDDDMRDAAAAWAKDRITVWDNGDEDSDFGKAGNHRDPKPAEPYTAQEGKGQPPKNVATPGERNPDVEHTPWSL